MAVVRGVVGVTSWGGGGGGGTSYGSGRRK